MMRRGIIVQFWKRIYPRKCSAVMTHSAANITQDAADMTHAVADTTHTAADIMCAADDTMRIVTDTTYGAADMLHTWCNGHWASASYMFLGYI